MAEITAKLIQELREKTSAGMMDCKKALIENNGDIDSLENTLRNIIENIELGEIACAKTSFTD